MKQLEPDLWQTTRHSIGEVAHTHAYLLTRPSGNLLIYGLGYRDSGGSDDDLDQIETLGGVQVQILSHRDESGPSLNLIRDRFGSRLACSALEQPAISADAAIDLTVGAGCDDPELSGLEILDTPGHTDGSISFRYRSPHGKTYLFTGDTIFPNNGDWGVFVFEAAGGNAESLEQSLLLLREQQPDLVLSSAHVGDTAVAPMTQNQWANIINQRIERLHQWAGAHA